MTPQDETVAYLTEWAHRLSTDRNNFAAAMAMEIEAGNVPEFIATPLLRSVGFSV